MMTKTYKAEDFKEIVEAVKQNLSTFPYEVKSDKDSIFVTKDKKDYYLLQLRVDNTICTHYPETYKQFSKYPLKEDSLFTEIGFNLETVTVYPNRFYAYRKLFRKLAYRHPRHLYIADGGLYIKAGKSEYLLMDTQNTNTRALRTITCGRTAFTNTNEIKMRITPKISWLKEIENLVEDIVKFWCSLNLYSESFLTLQGYGTLVDKDDLKTYVCVKTVRSKGEPVSTTISCKNKSYYPDNSIVWNTGKNNLEEYTEWYLIDKENTILNFICDKGHLLSDTKELVAFLEEYKSVSGILDVYNNVSDILK